MLLFLFIIAITDDVIFKTEQNIEFELILNDLEYLRNHPIDLNSASVEELAQITFLTLNSSIKIVEYRERRGSFESVNDLLNVSGFDKALVDMIGPYVTVGIKRVDVKKIAARTRMQTELPAEKQSSEYQTRMSILVDQYGFYAVTEKDEFESRFFDHYAVGLSVDDGIRKFALGKYNLDLGAGAVLSTVGSFFRGIDFRIMLNERRLLPYTSTIENGGFFGAAFSDSFFVNYTLFYSNQQLDGRIDSLGFARSFDESGIHVDSLSLSRQDQINEEILGYDIRYRRSNMLISNRAYHCSYNPAFVTTDSVAKFYGDNFFTTSVEFRYFGDVFVMFSEVARSWKNRIGGIFGFSAVFPYIDFNLAGKYFPGGFYSPKGIEATANLAGGTVDIKHHSPLVDVGLNFGLENRLDEDTTRYDLKLSFAKRVGILNARVNFRRRYRDENKDLSGSEVLLRISPVRFLFFDLRFEEKSVYLEQVEDGIFGALEVGLDFKNLDVRVRYGVFQTDSYDARVYAYEIDLPGILNNRMLYGKGDYGFVYLSVRMLQNVKLGMKYSMINRDSKSVTRIGGQFDFRF
jgi:competence ComEA-like helix-hairpin-helix protein